MDEAGRRDAAETTAAAAVVVEVIAATVEIAAEDDDDDTTVETDTEAGVDTEEATGTAGGMLWMCWCNGGGPGGGILKDENLNFKKSSPFKMEDLLGIYPCICFQ